MYLNITAILVLLTPWVSSTNRYFYDPEKPCDIHLVSVKLPKLCYSQQIGIWVIILFLFGLMVPMINNWGHGGGIVAGIGLGFLLGYQERKKENVFHKLLAGGCAIITILVLGWAVLSGIYIRFLV